MRLLALAASLLLAAPTPPPATDALTWGVAPANGRAAFDYKLDPGATLTERVAVTNHSARPLTLDLYASDAFTTASGGFDLLAAGQAPTGAGSWIAVPQRRIVVPSTSRVDIPFTLTVPPNATPGDHAAGIVASLATTGSDGAGNQVSVDHRVGTRVYLRVTGELGPSLAITDLRISTRQSWNPFRGAMVTAGFTVHNTGNVRLSGLPSLTTHGPFGLARQTTGGPPLPEILPGGSLRTEISTRVPPLFRLGTTAAVQPEAAADTQINPALVRVTAGESRWLVPWPQLALLLLTGAVVTVALLIRRRRALSLAAALETARAQGRAEALHPTVSKEDR